MQSVFVPRVRTPAGQMQFPANSSLRGNMRAAPLYHRSHRYAQTRLQTTRADSTHASSAALQKLDDVQSMYSQLAQRTQIIYRQGQEDAHKVTSLNEQLARKEQELAFERQQRSTSDSKRAKFGGILRKLFRRHTKATSQLEADLVKARQESQQNAEAAQHYLRKWTESMEELEEEAHRKQKAKAAQTRLAQELDTTQLKLRKLARVL